MTNEMIYHRFKSIRRGLILFSSLSLIFVAAGVMNIPLPKAFNTAGFSLPWVDDEAKHLASMKKMKQELPALKKLVEEIDKSQKRLIASGYCNPKIVYRCRPGDVGDPIEVATNKELKQQLKSEFPDYSINLAKVNENRSFLKAIQGILSLITILLFWLFQDMRQAMIITFPQVDLNRKVASTMNLIEYKAPDFFATMAIIASFSYIAFSKSYVIL